MSGLDSQVRCADACVPVDAPSTDLIELVLADALELDAAAQAWREIASQTEKRLEEQRKDLIKNWAG